MCAEKVVSPHNLYDSDCRLLKIRIETWGLAFVLNVGNIVSLLCLGLDYLGIRDNGDIVM